MAILVDYDVVMGLFRDAGKDPGLDRHIAGESGEQRIQRIIMEINTGQRSIQNVVSAISKLSGQELKPKFPAEVVTYTMVLNYFLEQGKDPASDQHISGESGEDRVRRIVIEINSGQRTIADAIFEIGRLDAPKKKKEIGDKLSPESVAKIILETFPWMKEFPGIWDMILSGVKDDLPNEVILANVRDTEAYKQRFPGMAARVSGKFNPINEAEYLTLEDSYRNLLSSYGILGILAPDGNALKGFFTDWIGGDVSPMELSVRLDKGYATMVDSALGVKETFREFYGIEIDDATLLTYFLDRDLGLLEMERVIGASKVGGAAMKYGLNITRTRAELLSSEGITEEMARRGFADVAREAPQLETLARMHSFNPLSQEDLESFVFHEDPGVMRRRRRIFDTALASFAGSGASSVTAQGALSELVDLDRSV